MLATEFLLFAAALTRSLCCRRNGMRRRRKGVSESRKTIGIIRQRNRHAPMSDGSRAIRFECWNEPTAGNQIEREFRSGTPDRNRRRQL
jgi:hypothetical protein